MGPGLNRNGTFWLRPNVGVMGLASEGVDGGFTSTKGPSSWSEWAQGDTKEHVLFLGVLGSSDPVDQAGLISALLVHS